MSDPWWTSDTDPWQQSDSASASIASSGREFTRGVARSMAVDKSTTTVDRAAKAHPQGAGNLEYLCFENRINGLPLNPDAVPFAAPLAGGSALNPDATPFPAPHTSGRLHLNPDATPFPAPPGGHLLNPDATPFLAPHQVGGAPLNPDAAPFPARHPVGTSALNPDATAFPAPPAGRSLERKSFINECCLDYESETLKKNGHVTFDEACSHIVQKSGIKLDVLLSETSAYPALQTLLRKEQALRMYLLSYRNLHSVWSIQDVRQQFPSSTFCRKEDTAFLSL